MKAFVLAPLALLAAVPAQAATLQYVLTGTDANGMIEYAKFRIDAQPVILAQNVGPGQGFRVKNLPGVFQYGSTIAYLRDVQFFNADLGGGFFDLDAADTVGDSFLLNVIGPQLYSGPEDAPTLLTGNFDLADAFSGAPLSLSVTGVPEPASWALMIAGFGMTGAGMRRRARVSVRYA